MVWTYITLMITTLTLFVTKQIYFWIVPCAASLFLALTTGTLTNFGLGVVVVQGILCYLMKKPFKPWLHGLIGLCITVITALLFFHLMPGFNNWLLYAGPPKYYYNFDKPIATLFILAFLIPPLGHPKMWWDVIKKSLPYTLIGIIVLCTIALLIGVIHFDFHIPPNTGPWLISGLLFTAVPEELFFRGFIQRELTEAIPKKWAPAAAIGITSIVFVIAHVAFTFNMLYLSVVFLASILYGLIYHKTRSVEAAIICHYLVNFLNFFFFT